MAQLAVALRWQQQHPPRVPTARILPLQKGGSSSSSVCARQRLIRDHSGASFIAPILLPISRDQSPCLSITTSLLSLPNRLNPHDRRALVLISSPQSVDCLLVLLHKLLGNLIMLRKKGQYNCCFFVELYIYRYMCVCLCDFYCIFLCPRLLINLQILP